MSTADPSTALPVRPPIVQACAVQAPATPARLSPPALPMRAGHLPMSEVIELYAAHYTGRDESRGQRLRWWQDRIGTIALQDLSDDHVHLHLEALADQNALYFAGKDEAGRPIMHAKRKRLSPATINRYGACLAAVITWAVKKRIAPKGYVHPCRSIERKPENNERTRFLSDAERVRLLDACKASTWPRLYVLVLAALTTGARKGELMGLTWADVDLVRAEAYVARTKNGSPRVLPLVPAVVAELQRMRGKPGELVFRSPRNPLHPFTFEPHYAAALQAARIRDCTFHTLRCPRRPNFDPPCRLNFDPGRLAEIA